MDELRAFFTWVRSLESGIAFMLLLPIFVAIAGFVAEWRDHRMGLGRREGVRAATSRSASRSPDSRSRTPGASANASRP